MQKTQTIMFSPWRCSSISDSFIDETNDYIVDTDLMYDKTNVAPFPTLSSNNSVTILVNNSALTKSLKVSLLRLFQRLL